MFRRSSNFVTAAVCATVLLATASAAQADNVTYAPMNKPVAGIAPLTATYQLQITSPAKLTAEGLEILASGLVANVRVSAADWPEGSSEATAKSLLTVDYADLLFTALSQSRTVNVTVSVPAGTIPGDYVLEIQADGPNKSGWGNASHTLALTIGQPVANGDITPPNVTIAAPLADQEFMFCSAGTAIPFAVDANDAESAVTTVGASFNGAPVALSAFTAGNNVGVNGTYMAGDIGAHTLAAWAASEGGTSAPVQETYLVKYQTSILPPLSLGKTSKGGSTIPIKFNARDCGDLFVADQRVKVEVFEKVADRLELRFTATFGEGSTNVRIDPVAGQYITNFTTAAGVHTYVAKVSFNGTEHLTVGFSVR